MHNGFQQLKGFSHCLCLTWIVPGGQSAVESLLVLVVLGHIRAQDDVNHSPPNILLQIHRFLSTIWKKVTPQLGEPIVPCVLDHGLEG